ncbi:MAG TPA: PspC domain-containing protein [Steroidobacteraceae bacterium]|nr:PspC domain-containing protein [Steroidobacteraceae bacterium]
MNKVVTVNLNGNAYSLEEPAYDALRAYLDGADARLQGNPDRAEIMFDLEQAIADKCRRYLGPSKGVVGNAEMERILAEMGPVEADAGEGETTARPEGESAPRPEAPRRLYQVREGAMISGVCNGLAAYLNVDVTIVRVAFVALAFLTGGIWALVYLIMMFVVPDANTPEKRAAASGQPFNAQELVDRAKQHYAELREQGSRWHDDWRRRRRVRRARRAAAAEREFWRNAGAYEDAGYATRLLAGFMVPVFTLLSAAIFVALVLAALSLLVTGSIFDWTLPVDIPEWAAVIILVIAYQALHQPLRAASRASYETTAGPRHGWLAAADGVLWLGFTALLFWLAYLLIPEVQSLFDDLRFDWRQLTLAWTGG